MVPPDRVVVAPADRRTAVLELIAGARNRLRVSLFRCDDYRVVDALADASSRGVDVEVLITPRARGGRKRLRELGSVFEGLGVTLRRYADPVVKYHAKYAVADEDTAMVASLNFTRKCFERTCDFVAITHDRAVVDGLHRLFDSDAGEAPLLPDALSPRLIVGPECARERISRLLRDATTRIRIIDHKVTDPDTLSLLNKRRSEGVDVQVLAGEVGGLKPHGKLMLIDDSKAVVGSLSLAALNLDFRREVALVVDEPAAVRTLGQFFQRVATATVPVLLAAVLLATPAAAQTSTGQKAKPEPERVRMDWNPRPSIRFGDWLRLDFRLKLQADFRTFDPQQEPEEGTFHFRRRRAGIQGVLFRRVEFEIEKELREDGEWRDVYLNLNTGNKFQLKGGKFKMPFGLEQNTGTMDLDFINRTLASDAISPARDRGVMAHGRFTRAFVYEAGVFRDDGENARLTEPQFLLPGEAPPAGGLGVAGRVVVTPIRRGPADERPRVGFAFTSASLPDGLNSLRGRSHFDLTFFPRVYVRGRRTRLGGEFEWNPNSLGFRAEYMRAADNRKGQGLGDVDLSDMIAEGWYASATWVVTGESKADGVRPDNPLFQGGFGAVELGTRIEALGFGSASHEGPAFANPRAEHIAENRNRAWTTGVTWFPNRWVKIQGNAIREHFTDATRTPLPGRQTFWSGVLRIQFVL